ncbi:MAG: glycyl radical protein [Planctomycetota bacterium]|nr:glycyl radical protein [Planctomycetota bacterium]
MNAETAIKQASCAQKAYEPTGRGAKLRQQVFADKPEVCSERCRIITELYRQTEDKPAVIRRACALKKILNEMSIFILDGELIVGNHASKPRSAPVFPEYSVDWILREMDEFDTRPGDAFRVSDENKKILRQLLPYWKQKTHMDRALGMISDSAKEAMDLGIISALGNLSSGDGHISVNVKSVLQEGLIGFRKRAELKLRQLDLSEPGNLSKRMFLESVLIVCGAASEFAGRFSLQAQQMARQEGNAVRKRELERIAAVCRRVPELPAESFHEAVQSAWFIQLILQIESNGHSFSFGRLDQYLWPYYKKDIDQQNITRGEALELIENLWAKTFCINKLRPWSHTRFGAGYPVYQNVTIGGQSADGQDATNEVSCLCLEAAANMRLPQPNLSVRYHSGSPDSFLAECVNVVKLGTGMPAFNNDEIIIPSLLERGVTPQDARNYSMIGCVEVAVPGKWTYRCTGMSFINFSKVLNLAINNGAPLAGGKSLCPGKGDLTAFKSFDEVVQAWREQIRFYTRLHVIVDNTVDTSLEQTCPNPFCSALVDDCIDRGKTIKEGGAVYDHVSGLQVGIANTGNALAAIRKLVFEEKTVSAELLLGALKSDFAGADGEQIRQRLLNNAPKYGNDIDYVDTLTKAAYDDYIREVEQYHNARFGRGPIGGGFYSSTVSISANVPMGAATEATPDGRKAGSPLAEGASPSQGTDRLGPTAVLKSIAKLSTIKMTGGQLLNLKFTPQALAGQTGEENLKALIRAFFDNLKGWHVQFNVVSTDTLKKAQHSPLDYANLLVRVAGYSALFVSLDPSVQNDIIARTENAGLG